MDYRRPRKSGIQVLAHLLASEGGAWGYQMAQDLSISPTVLYHILDRFEGKGWITKRTEIMEPDSPWKPPRKFVQLTDKGRAAAEQFID